MEDRETTWKDSVISLSKWAQDNWIFIIIIETALWSLFLFLVGSSWLVGYYVNAYVMAINFTSKEIFNLASCWTGVGVVASAFAPLVALGGAAWAKKKEDIKQYEIDSSYNSVQGQMPEKLRK